MKPAKLRNLTNIIPTNLKQQNIKSKILANKNQQADILNKKSKKEEPKVENKIIAQKKIHRVESMIHKNDKQLKKVKSEKRIRSNSVKQIESKEVTNTIIPKNMKKQPIKEIPKQKKLRQKKQSPLKMQASLPLKKQNKIVIDKNITKEDSIKKVVSQPTEQKDMGLLYIKPQNDKILYQQLETTDRVYDKYVDMICNDNDTAYVINALPEIKDHRKLQQKKLMEPILTGRFSNISTLFQNITVDKIITIMKSKPYYFQSKVKVSNLKIILQTKFKVSVDIGFMQYCVENDKIIIERIYITKIYRKMNYVAYIYLEAMKFLTDKYSNIEKCCILNYQKNASIIKFYKYMGFKIERVLSDNKSLKMEHFHEFVSKKKQFLAFYSNIS